jgi:hypothetical protein
MNPVKSSLNFVRCRLVSLSFISMAAAVRAAEIMTSS